jgi:hypothetical protein
VRNQLKAFSLLSVAMSDAVEEERCRRRLDPLDDLNWAADGTWYARRNDHGEIMQATDPERLSFMIRDDYFHRSEPDGPSAGS